MKTMSDTQNSTGEVLGAASCSAGGYWLKAPWQAEYQEVSKKEYLKAEAAAGFFSKFSPGHCATSSFGCSGTRGQTWSPNSVIPKPYHKHP
jgi:hypothetical protein